MIVNNYQIYAIVRNLVGLDKTKSCNTKAWQTFLTKSIDEILAEGFYRTPAMQNGAGRFTDVANNISSGVFSLADYLISICVEYMITEKFPTLKSCSQVDKRREFFIFSNRREVIEQSKWLREKVAKENEGLLAFSNKYTLFKVDDDQKNEIYKLIKSNKINPEFYIRGLVANKFQIDESKIQDKEYMKFVKMAKIILNLKR